MYFQEFFDKLIFLIEDHIFGSMTFEMFRHKMELLFNETQADEDGHKKEVNELIQSIQDLKGDAQGYEDAISELEDDLESANKWIDKLEDLLNENKINF